MQNQQQTHKLTQSWEAEDYARSAHQSAQVSAKYHQLITQRTGVIDADLAQVRQELQLIKSKSDREISLLKKEVKRLEGSIDGNRNQCLVWGAGGAIVMSLVLSLVFTPGRSTVQPQRSFNSNVQRGF